MSKKIILGTVQFGLDYGINNNNGKPDVVQVFDILKLAAASGIEIIDTADVYGNASELLGEFNKVYPDYFKINTKFKVGQDTISKQVAKSLDNLYVSSINTYFFHSYNDFINYPSLLSELGFLKEKRLIQKIGVSVYDNDEFGSVINSPDVDVIQFPFNLLDNRHQKEDLMKLAISNGKELQVRSVFLQGLFFMPLDSIPIKLSPLKPYLRIIREMADDYKISINEVALLYAFNQPEIDHIIIGVDNTLQLQKNLFALQERISSDLIEKINKLDVLEKELLYPKNWN